MTPLTDVRQISRIGYGFIASKVLFSSLELDIYSQLADGPRTAAELAKNSPDVTEDRLLALLNACVTLGLLVREGDTFANAPACQTYLVRSSPAYYGDYYRFQIEPQLYPSLLELHDAMHGKPVTPLYELVANNPEEAELFSQAQHVGSLGPAYLMARKTDLSNCETLLDVAGGSGAFSITFCQRYPQLHSTILDFESVIEIAHKFVGEANLLDRISFVAGNALKATWPVNQDVILMSYLISAVSKFDVETLIKQAFASLKPGGRFIIHDFMLYPDLSGPTTAALFLFMSVFANPHPVSLTPQLLIQLLQGHGFEQIQDQTLIPEITTMITAVKPNV